MSKGMYLVITHLRCQEKEESEGLEEHILTRTRRSLSKPCMSRILLAEHWPSSEHFAELWLRVVYKVLRLAFSNLWALYTRHYYAWRAAIEIVEHLGWLSAGLIIQMAINPDQSMIDAWKAVLGQSAHRNPIGRTRGFWNYNKWQELQGGEALDATVAFERRVSF